MGISSDFRLSLILFVCKIAGAICLIATVCTCNLKKKEYFPIDRIEAFLPINNDLPEKNSGITLFVRISDEKIGVIKLGMLRTLYEFSYRKKYKLQTDFYYNSLNQYIRFSEKEIINRGGVIVKLNENIYKQFELKGINYITYTYTTPQKKGYYMDSKIIDNNDKFTILYIFFMLGYSIEFDDYIGMYIIQSPLQ